jgi:hypothetical protein
MQQVKKALLGRLAKAQNNGHTPKGWCKQFVFIVH